MQIAPITILPHPITMPAPSPTPAPAPTPGPIGVGSFGTMRVGFALNGVKYQDFKLLAPMSGPAGVFKGSYSDAIAGAQKLAQELTATRRTEAVLALTMGTVGTWNAIELTLDQAASRALINGAGHGGIASIEFTQLSRSLAALVTPGKVIEPRIEPIVPHS